MAWDGLCKPLCEGNFFVAGFSIIMSGLGLLGADHWRSMVYIHKQVVWNRRVLNAGSFQSTERLTPGRWEWKWLQIARCTNYANDCIYPDRNSRRPLSLVWMHTGVTRKRRLVCLGSGPLQTSSNLWLTTDHVVKACPQGQKLDLKLLQRGVDMERLILQLSLDYRSFFPPSYPFYYQQFSFP